MNQILNYSVKRKNNILKKDNFISTIINVIWTVFFFITMSLFIVGAIVIFLIPTLIAKLFIKLTSLITNNKEITIE